jgi:hypothetical protein
MRFQMVVTDRGKRLVVPFTKKEIRDMSDIWWYFDEQHWKDMKLNKVDKSIEKCERKFHFLCHDVLHNGTTYQCIFEKDGKFNGKFKKMPGFWYFIKKPKWKVI